MKKILILLIYILTTNFCSFSTNWNANWIMHPTLEPASGAMVLFRKTFDLNKKPDIFTIHISADNHYRLFVNGKYITRGPARGDLNHWHYETIDIAAFLSSGKNLIAVEVINWGEHRSFTYFSQLTSLIIQGDTEKEHLINTQGGSWKCIQNKAYSPRPVNWMTDRTAIDWGFYVSNPTDSIRAENYPYGWEQNDFDDSNWLWAKFSDGVGFSKNLSPGGFVYAGAKALTPRITGLPEEKMNRFAVVRRCVGIEKNDDFIHGKGSFTIPANNKVSIVIDNQELTMGYPELWISKGKNAQVKITYSENPIIAVKSAKGNRNDIDGKYFVGIKDIFIPDGGNNRLFKPTYLRAFRYIQLDIETHEQELQINDYYHVTSKAPVSLKAQFATDNDTLNQILDAGRRTAFVCAQDILMSDASYEQMQYVGDSRVHNLTMLALTGDDRLTRNSLIQFNNSRIPEGLTLACYPNAYHLVIPSYSLIWIDQIYDYMMWKGDKEFVSGFLSGINSVLDWFENHRTRNGLLTNMEGWCALGWPKDYISGVPPVEKTDANCLYSLHYAYTLRHAAEVFKFAGRKKQADEFTRRADAICKAVNRYCKNEAGFYTESDKNQQISQITNLMAILAGANSGKESKQLMKKLLEMDNSFGAVDLFLHLYLFEAINKTGYENSFMPELSEWKLMLERGMTTFAEVPLEWGEENQRSECHPWSTAPDYFFFSTVCGIKALKPGYQSVLIEPEFGSLQSLDILFPHPNATIDMKLKRKGKQIQGEIIIPDSISATFKWENKNIKLKAGKNTINL